jgi:hypothetical protein
MTATNIFKRLAARNKNKNPDWARVEEPDTIVKPVWIGVVGLVIAAFSMLAAWNVMTISPIDWIAYFLVSLHSTMPFTQLYAAFTSAVIVMVDLMVATIFMFFSTADNDDVIEMISDLDANFQERIVEHENSFNEKLENIKSDL